MVSAQQMLAIIINYVRQKQKDDSLLVWEFHLVLIVCRDVFKGTAVLQRNITGTKILYLLPQENARVEGCIFLP
jgi:hypothetical protein